MTIHHSRRGALALGLMLALLAGGAAAQDYPTRSVKLIVPYGAGGASDVMARFLAQKLGDKLGQTVVVENMPGAAGTTAYVAMSKATADGYTLGYVTSSLAINAVLKKVGYDPVGQFTPVSNFVEIQNVLIVPASSPAKSVKDLIAMARTKPDALNYVSLGSGSTPHLSAELFLSAAGAKAQPVPYKQTTQAYTDLMEGRVQFWIASMPSTLPHVRSGKVRALAVASTRRAPVYPDVPTLIESGVQAESTFWQGVFVPTGTPQAIITKLNKAMHEIAATEDAKAFYGKLGAELAPGTAAELSGMVKSEMAKWAKIGKDIGLVEK